VSSIREALQLDEKYLHHPAAELSFGVFIVVPETTAMAVLVEMM
jgi:hypothetical protein